MTDHETLIAQLRGRLACKRGPYSTAHYCPNCDNTIDVDDLLDKLADALAEREQARETVIVAAARAAWREFGVQDADDAAFESLCAAIRSALPASVDQGGWRKYVEHQFGCPMCYAPEWRSPEDVCTCGLDQLLGPPAPPHQEPPA